MTAELPKTKDELKHWALRRLGAPVICINVDDEQLEDRICEALRIFQDRHFDGSHKTFIQHRITATTIAFDVAIGTIFSGGRTITGQTSGATATVLDQDINNLFIRVRDVKGTFIDGEVIEEEISLISETIAATSAVVLGDLDNRSIPVPPGVLSIVDILPLSSSAAGDLHLFDFEYHERFRQNFGGNLGSGGGGSTLQSIVFFEKHLTLLQNVLDGDIRFRFNRKMDQLFIDFDWRADAILDGFIVIEAMETLDPATYPEIYCDEFVMDYTTALFKLQWAQNLSKHKGAVLPGGLTLNADEMMTQALQELEKLDERLRKEFNEPVDFIVG